MADEGLKSDLTAPPIVEFENVMTGREKAIVFAHTGYDMVGFYGAPEYFKYLQEKLGKWVFKSELKVEDLIPKIRAASMSDYEAICEKYGVKSG